MAATSPNYGRRLIPQILDSLAVADPNRVVYSVTELHEDGPRFRDITARAFSQAVDKTAWWLHKHVGELNTPSQTFEEHKNDTADVRKLEIQPLGYIGPHDLRYVLLSYGAVKAGHSAMFLSPKNNVEGATAVLKVAKCRTWVKPREIPLLPLISEVRKQYPLDVLEFPTVDDLLDAASTAPFSYTARFEDVINQPFCILHTSGTTGVPKPIIWSHGLIGTMDAVRLLPPVEGDNGLKPWTDNWNEGDRIYSSFPMSHGAGIIMDILMPSLFNLHCVLGPSGVLPNIGLLESLADHARIDIWSMVPSLADELGETPNVLEKFRSSKFICASGGPVSPLIVSKVNDVTRVLNLTGTTEGLFIGNLWVDREDWHWFAFHPYSGFDFREVQPGVFEHWVHRNEHWPLFQGIFYTFPEDDAVNLKDLYVRHPTKPYLWAFSGRSDDVIVLSNGYKISPLDTEALITTHPMVDGCLLIGTGKPQAGLLVELKDPSARTVEVFDSIWATVERANNLTFLKTRLQRDYIAFTEPDKPFIRTDKRTIKRRATLSLYADFIDRFYNTRDTEANNADVDGYPVDTSSVESIKGSLIRIFNQILPDVDDLVSDEDVFELGLDSLLVFRVIKIIQNATGLHEELAPRHLYANPTLDLFSIQISRIIEQVKSKRATLNGNSKGTPHSDSTDAEHSEGYSKVQETMMEHKRRLGFKMNPFDAVNPNHYMGLNFYFALRPDVQFEEAFAQLQAGLARAFSIIPELDGKMTFASDHEFGYKKGQYRITIPPRPLAVGEKPRQLVFKDLSDVLPKFSEMRDAGFAPSLFSDKLVLDCHPFPAMPADILVAQANFVEGGCILATNFIHTCLDGIGVMVALRVWAECCRFLQGESSATCEWFDPESFNHSLPQILHEHESWTKPASDVDPGVWGYLPFFAPEEENAGSQAHGKSTIKTVKDHIPNSAGIVLNGRSGTALPPVPVFDRQPTWPKAPAERSLGTTVFLLSGQSIQRLKDEALADPFAKQLATSVSDIIQAFFWRASIRSRYRVRTQLRGETFTPDQMSILELPIDGRPYFSPMLPSSYMGSMLILNRPTMPIDKLCSPTTSIGMIANVIRKAAMRITPSLVHDAFTLLEALPDYSKPATANMGIEHMNAMVSNLMLFQTSEISFGNAFFEGGCAEAMRPQIERGHRRFRFLVISPLRKDGGVELVLGTLPEELEMLKTDQDFMRHAILVEPK
ncbi:transferase family protein [Stagonosporopsis vannaccii]|nr:transferase family protein [Stagonosporopsis vannaccii]